MKASIRNILRTALQSKNPEDWYESLFPDMKVVEGKKIVKEIDSGS